MDDGEIIEQVLREVSRRSLFGQRAVPLGDDFVVVVSRDWMDPGEDVTDKITLTLKYTGPTKGPPEIYDLDCDGMLEVLANLAKLMEDKKKMKWNAKKEKWTF